MTADDPAAEVAINVPEGEKKRQAIDALRGYVYQLYASSLAWTRLAPDQTLLLEVAEDYAVVARDAVNAVQVKDTANSGTVTLRNDGVVKLLNSYWAFQKANPERVVTAAYLTTSAIGHEKGMSFPGGKPGLEHWRDATREGVSLDALKAVLVSLPLEPDLLAWIGTADDNTLKAELLGRLRWACGAPSLANMERLLDEALITLGERLHLAPSDAKQARGAVLGELLARIVSSDADSRRLTRAQLLEVIEQATSVAVPRASMRQMLGAMGAGGVATAIQVPGLLNDVREFPQPPLAVARPGFSAKINEAIAASGLVWLHGATGAGKTSACIETLRASNRPWRLVELRGQQAGTIAERLRLVRAALLTDPEAGGVILDDFPTEAAAALKLQLALLRDAIAQMDGGLVLTSYTAPGPTTQASLTGIKILKAPEMSEPEVAELVRVAGGDPALWSRPVRLISGGHPQLASARVWGLRERGWPHAELTAGIFPDQRAIDIDAERAEVRSRLVAELSDQRRLLLYRLSLVFSGFDRPLGLAVAGAIPAISQPGEAFDFLVGPWIEAVGGGRYRVSPLVYDAGKESLSAVETLAVHNAICDALIKRRPFPGDLLGQLLASAMLTTHKGAIHFIIGAALTVRDEDRAAVMFELRTLALFTTDRLLVPSNKRLSILLRFTQLRVALEDAEMDAARIYERLLIEAEGEKQEEDFATSATFTYLGRETGQMPPRVWFPLLQRLERLAPEASSVAAAELQAKTGMSQGTAAHFMFLWRVTRLASIAELEELFCILEEAGSETRGQYFDALRGPDMGFRGLVQMPWVNDSRADDFAPLDAVERYRVLTEHAERWGEKTLALECVAGQVSLLAEYAKNTDAALALLDEVEAKWPGEGRLRRERTKILFHLGRHDEVIAETPELLRTFNVDPIERAHALRELAISTAKQGDNFGASTIFGQAADVAASSPAMDDFRAGLLGDKVFVEFSSGDHEKALRTLVEAVRATDAIDRDTDRGGFVIRMIAGLEAWIVTQLGENIDPEVGMVLGACSGNPPTNPFPNPVPLKQVLWYQLSVIERMMELSLELHDEIERHVEGQRIPLFEASYSLQSIQIAVRSGDARQLVGALIRNAPIFEYVRSVQHTFTPEQFQQIAEDMPWLDATDFNSSIQKQIAAEGIISFLAYAQFALGVDLVDEVATVLREAKLTESLADIPALFDLELSASLDAPDATAAALAYLRGNPEADASKLLLATFRIWEWLNRAAASAELVRAIASRLQSRWAHLVGQATFSLRSPMMTVPPIRQALTTMETRNDIGRLLLAANDATKPNFASEALQSIRASLNS